MALNVNIIGRDSEGNLRALKVNSDGNLEISGFSEWGELLQDIFDKLELVEAELQTIKTNQLSGDQKVQLSGTMVVEYLDDEHQYSASRVFGLNARMAFQTGFQPFPNRGSRYTIIYRNKGSEANSIRLNFYKEATITTPDDPPQRIANTANVSVASGETLTWNSESPEMEALVSGGFPYFAVRLGGPAGSKQDVIIAGGGHA